MKVLLVPTEQHDLMTSTLETALLLARKFDSYIEGFALRQRLGENVVVAWNGSTEQARATAFAMPLLRSANRVTVVTVEGGTVPGPTGAQLARYLQRNGIPAEPVTLPPERRSTGEALLAKADALGCDLLVKGAYTQSRLRQMIFGGMTRHILASAQLPVLMAH